jgi:hypothetical protein
MIFLFNISAGIENKVGAEIAGHQHILRTLLPITSDLVLSNMPFL